MQSEAPAIDSPPDSAAEPPAQTPEELARQWLDSIKQAKKLFDTKFYRNGERATKEYRLNVTQDDSEWVDSRFPIFWSNIQTLAPATYSRKPKAEVTRRFRDQDPVGRVAGLILERALQYEIDLGLGLHETMKAVVLDRLIPGMGCAWVRYEPEFANKTVLLPNPIDPAAPPTEQQQEVLSDEFTPVDYVFWKDFLMSPARTWADVRWVARRLMFSRTSLKARFGESLAANGGDISEVPCNYDPYLQDPDNRDKVRPSAGEPVDPTLERALVWEIWDRESRQAIWVVENYPLPLDFKPDPLKLRGFFPCPKPVFATQTNDTLVPVADFVIYKSQIRELNQVTNRISLLTQALRVIGVYDASQQSIASLLQTGLENRMVPVDQWGAFAEKGGLKGVMDFLPIEQIVKVLTGLYESREQLKQTVYEIMGMADIIRGSSIASETLGAQQIKAKFASLRLSARQGQVDEFVTEVLNLKAELMCEFYSDETLIAISSAQSILEVQKHPEALPAALQLLRNEKLRQYRISVAAKSMVEVDEAEEQENRTKFISNVANFMLAMKNVSVLGPEMVPVALEMLKFVVRGFPVGKGLEVMIDDAMESIVQRLAQPQPQPPTPEQVKQQTTMMQEQAEDRRLIIKEDAATDREELKAAVALTTAGMQAEAAQTAAIQAQLDAQMDRDQEAELSALQGGLQ